MSAVYSPMRAVVTAVGRLILKIFGALCQPVRSFHRIFPKILVPSYGRLEAREATSSLSSKESEADNEVDNKQSTIEVSSGLENSALYENLTRSPKSVSDERIAVTRTTRSGKVYSFYI